MTARQAAEQGKGRKSHNKIVAEKLNKYWGQQNVESRVSSCELRVARLLGIVVGANCLLASGTNSWHVPSQSGRHDSGSEASPHPRPGPKIFNEKRQSAVSSPLFVNNTKWKKWDVAAAARVCMAQCRRRRSPGSGSGSGSGTGTGSVSDVLSPAYPLHRLWPLPPHASCLRFRLELRNCRKCFSIFRYASDKPWLFILHNWLWVGVGVYGCADCVNTQQTALSPPCFPCHSSAMHIFNMHSESDAFPMRRAGKEHCQKNVLLCLRFRW